MELIKRHFNLSISFLFFVLYLSVFAFARHVINQDTAEFKDARDDEKKSFEVKPVKVNFVIQGPYLAKTMQFRLENKDTLGDLLEHARESGFLTYEIKYTVSGTKIIAISNVFEEGKEWVFYDETTLVGSDFEDYKLDDNNTYYLRLE